MPQPEGEAGERLYIADVGGIDELDGDIEVIGAGVAAHLPAGGSSSPRSGEGPPHRGQYRVKLLRHSARDQDKARRMGARQATGEGFCRYEQLIDEDRVEIAMLACVVVPARCSGVTVDTGTRQSPRTFARYVDSSLPRPRE